MNKFTKANANPKEKSEIGEINDISSNKNVNKESKNKPLKKTNQTNESEVNGDRVASNNDVNLRPLTFDDYIGQEKAIKNLKIFIQASKMGNEAMPHTIIQGSAGLGKTTLANIIANEMGANIYYTSAPAIEKPYELVMLLTKLEKGDILFIDEIHRLKINLEELLYLALEDRVVDVSIKREFEESKTIRMTLEEFTLIGATTKIGSLSKPLIDRFSINIGLQPYSQSELMKIVNNVAIKQNITVDEDALREIADRSRTVARVALKNFKIASSYAIVQNSSHLTKEITIESLENMGILKYGFSDYDISYLKALQGKKRGLSLKALTSIIMQSEESVINIIEPFLLANQLVTVTSAGRKITELGENALREFNV